MQQLRSRAGAQGRISRRDWARRQSRPAHILAGAIERTREVRLCRGTTVGVRSKGFSPQDLILCGEAPWDATVTASPQNVFNKDPSYVPIQYNCDHTNGNPLGRVFELGFKKRF